MGYGGDLNVHYKPDSSRLVKEMERNIRDTGPLLKLDHLFTFSHLQNRLFLTIITFHNCLFRANGKSGNH